MKNLGSVLKCGGVWEIMKTKERKREKGPSYTIFLPAWLISVSFIFGMGGLDLR